MTAAGEGAPRVLHLIAAEPNADACVDGMLDATLIAIASLGGDPTIETVGPFRGAHRAAAALGLSIARTRVAPGRLPELAWRSIRRSWRNRVDVVHCWGAAAAALARLGLPGVPRVFTPTSPVPEVGWSALSAARVAAARESAGAFFDPGEQRAWHADRRSSVVPVPSGPPSVDRARARQRMGLEPGELLVVPLTDTETSTRRAAATTLVAVLGVAGIHASVLARHGPHARRGRRLASRSTVDLRLLPWTAPLPVVLAAADFAVVSPDTTGREPAGSAGLVGVLTRTACRAGVPCVVPDGATTGGDLPPALAMLQTPDASPVGLAQRAEAHLLDVDARRAAAASAAAWDEPERDARAFRDAMLELYSRAAEALRA
ncbi:MAG: hypothetical protein AAF108_06870 [Planctomycetota bacterium]